MMRQRPFKAWYLRRWSGNSVLTALATGVASLILASCRINKIKVNKAKRREKIEFWFNKIKGRIRNMCGHGLCLVRVKEGLGVCFCPKNIVLEYEIVARVPTTQDKNAPQENQRRLCII